jgi:hypothetical protein
MTFWGRVEEKGVPEELGPSAEPVETVLQDDLVEASVAHIPRQPAALEGDPERGKQGQCSEADAQGFKAMFLEWRQVRIHRNTLYFTMQYAALRASFHPIFFP